MSNHEITIKMTPNTLENRRKLKEGYRYIVLYLDIQADQNRLASGKWTSSGWKWPKSRFTTGMKPEFEKTANNHWIMGWSRLIDWREDE